VFKLAVEVLTDAVNVLIIEPLALTDAENEFKLAVEVFKELVTPLNSGLSINPVPTTIVLILDVILAEVCCILSFILDDKNVVVTAILADIPLDGFHIEDDNAEPDEYINPVVVATELLNATNSASVAYPLSKLAIAAKLWLILLSNDCDIAGNVLVTKLLL
jgi:hypothetical protein